MASQHHHPNVNDDRGRSRGDDTAASSTIVIDIWMMMLERHDQRRGEGIGAGGINFILMVGFCRRIYFNLVHGVMTFTSKEYNSPFQFSIILIFPIRLSWLAPIATVSRRSAHFLLSRIRVLNVWKRISFASLINLIKVGEWIWSHVLIRIITTRLRTAVIHAHRPSLTSGLVIHNCSNPILHRPCIPFTLVGTLHKEVCIWWNQNKQARNKCWSIRHDLIHTRKVLPSSKVTHFHGFTTIFAGLGSPSIDDSFQELSPPGSDITIHLKFVKANEFHNYSPVSSGFFDPQFHPICITMNTVHLITKGICSKMDCFQEEVGLLIMELYHLWDLGVIMHSLNHLHLKAQMKSDTGIIVKVSLTCFGHFFYI